MNPEVVEKIMKGEPQMTDRPADHIAPQLEKFKEECKQWTQQPEDVLSYALFPTVAKEYFEYRDAQQSGIAKTAADKENKAYPV
jgi:oxaloacetate decarboxylase alpha subunit